VGSSRAAKQLSHQKGLYVIRIIVKLFAVTIVLTAFLHVALPIVPAHAAGPRNFVYLSASGVNGQGCTGSAPCPTFGDGFAALEAAETGGRILCLDPVADVSSMSFALANIAFDIDCPGGSWGGAPNGAGYVLLNNGSNVTLTFRNMAFDGVGGPPSAFQMIGSGTLIFENCVFQNFSGIALDIEPTGPFNLVITNSRMSNNSGGVVLKPGAGGSVTATFNGVTIAGNMGGGLKSDTTNGAVSLDISNSTISNNAGNGMNAVSGAGGTNMLNIKNSVIARNGSAGVQANGANAAALVNNTLLDSNKAGATSAIGGGRILTYGNNSIVGTSGSGFTGAAPLQ
jgi:hypothetical protein